MSPKFATTTTRLWSLVWTFVRRGGQMVWVVIAAVVVLLAHRCDAEQGQALTWAPDVADPVIATVTDVPASDVITIVDAEGDRREVRVLGLLDLLRRPDQASRQHRCWAAGSRQRAKRLLAGKTVVVSGDPTRPEVDRGGRALVYLTIHGTDYGLEMLRAGAARETANTEPYQRAGAYDQAEEMARSTREGLWGKCR